MFWQAVKKSFKKFSSSLSFKILDSYNNPLMSDFMTGKIKILKSFSQGRNPVKASIVSWLEVDFFSKN